MSGPDVPGDHRNGSGLLWGDECLGVWPIGTEHSVVHCPGKKKIQDLESEALASLELSQLLE